MKEIALTQGKVALVDDMDFDWLNQWKWFVHGGRHGKYYAARQVRDEVTRRQHKVWMHRQILQPNANEEIDHINGNGLDNRRENLRTCTSQQNGWNRRRVRKEGYKGVYYRSKGRGGWVAMIGIGGVRKYLGYFKTADEAAAAYDKAALELFGEFARLNVVPIDSALETTIEVERGVLYEMGDEPVEVLRREAS